MGGEVGNADIAGEFPLVWRETVDWGLQGGDVYTGRGSVSKYCAGAPRSGRGWLRHGSSPGGGEVGGE